jgi:hypothetical protein
LINSQFEDILLLQQSPEQLYVKIWQRQPILTTMTDKLRFVTASGVVYGIVEDEEAVASLPRLKGLFDDKHRQFTVTPHNSLTLTPFEQQLLTEAAALALLLEGDGFKVSTIDFVMHRGFLCRLKDKDTTVSFGRAPFDKKMAKLHKVLAHLASKGTSAQRIELDYIGKAFIKEKIQ